MFLLSRITDAIRRRREDRKSREMRIFPLRIPGQPTQWVDPLPAASGLESRLGENWKNLIVKLYTPPPAVPAGMPVDSLAGVLKADKAAKEEAGERVAAAVRETFGLHALAPDGSGVTVAGAIGIAADLLVFLATVARAARPL